MAIEVDATKGVSDIYVPFVEETRRVVTASEDGSALVWKFSEKELQCEAALTFACGGHHAGITSVAFAPACYNELAVRGSTGAVLATASKDCSLKIWTLEGLKPPKCSTLAARPGFYYSAVDGEDPSAAAQEASKAKPSEGHKDFVNMVSWYERAEPRSRAQLVSSSTDMTARTWDVASGRCTQTLRKEGIGHSGAVSMAQFSHDGNLLLTCSQDKLCILWDPQKEDTLMKTFPSHQSGEAPHAGAVWSARFCCDSSKIVTASADHKAFVWSVVTGHVEGRLLHDDAVLSARWARDDKTLVLTCSYDGCAKLWDLRAKQAVNTFRDHDTSVAVWSAEFGQNNNTVLTASHDMNAHVYDLRFNMPKHVLSGHNGILWQASLTNDGRWAITCSEDGTARVWNIHKGDRYPSFHVLKTRARQHTEAVTCADFQEFVSDSGQRVGQI